MLKVGVGAICESLLLASLGIEFDKVAGDILELGLGALLESLPLTSAEC